MAEYYARANDNVDNNDDVDDDENNSEETDTGVFNYDADYYNYNYNDWADDYHTNEGRKYDRRHRFTNVGVVQIADAAFDAGSRHADTADHWISGAHRHAVGGDHVRRDVQRDGQERCAGRQRHRK